MNELIVLPAQCRDAENIAPNLRIEDIAEVQAASGQRPEVVLPQCVEYGRTWKAVVAPGSTSHGLHSLPPVALFGVSTPNVPWLVATPELLKHKKSFLVQSKSVLAQMHSIGGRHLSNYADARNTTHLRWLRWLGFVFTHLEPEYGVARIPFWHFERTI